jgi:inner membrane protein
VFATSLPWIEFRRGWTHGILAQLTLPIAWTGLVWLFDRVRRQRGSPGDRPFHAGWTLLLALVGVYSHVFLDLLNNYGVRLMTPVSWQWFYGDAVFIVDPWMWIALAAGVWTTGSRGGPRPARVALVVVSSYIVAMLTSASVARGIVSNAWQATHGAPPRALMVGPVPLTPFARQVIVDAGGFPRTPMRRKWPPREATTTSVHSSSGPDFRSGPSKRARAAHGSPCQTCGSLAGQDFRRRRSCIDAARSS